VVRRVDATMNLLDFPADVAPSGAQLVGCDPDVMAEAARICVERGAATVDVNLGCPVKRVVTRGGGAALARDIADTARVLAAMVDAVNVPVTAKMRLGWDNASINAPELSRALQDVGVAAVSVHGRTRAQAYRGSADWREIARVKEAVAIPVIGSGDVSTPEQIARDIDSGVVDGVVVARGALGNLWLLQRAVRHVATGETVDELSFGDRIALSRRHVDLLIDHYGETKALKIGRKYVAWTIKGCNNASKLRAAVQDLTTRDALNALWDKALAAGLSPQGWFQPVFTSGDG
jgi:tRNA-dihydrouridine synthase B